MAEHDQPEYQRTLRRLALNDERLFDSMLASQRGNLEVSRLDPRIHALVRLGALLALDVTPASLRAYVDEALDAGATEDEIVGALIAVTPVIGSARAVMRVPTLALAMDYDVEAALEVLDEKVTR